MPDISLITLIGGAPTSGIVCSAYKASRFGVLPVPYDTVAPGGAADATATSGTNFGGPGQVSLTVPTWEEYWIALPSGGHIAWVKSPSPVAPESDITNLISDLGLKAPLASPTFTGTVTSPNGVTGLFGASFTFSGGSDYLDAGSGGSINFRTNNGTAGGVLASIDSTGKGTFNGGLNSPLPAFVAADKYVTIDSSGNLHKSAIGPAS